MGFSRLSRLQPSDWLLLVEATAALTRASVAIKCLPFHRLMRMAGRRRRPNGREGKIGDSARVAWAIEAAARRMPWRTVCLHKGIAAQALLRRRGLPGLLHYGIKPGDGALSAHVWVTCGGLPVVGTETAPQFARVAVFPPDEQA